MSPFISKRDPAEAARPAFYNAASALTDMDNFSHQHHFNSSPLLGGGDEESWHFYRDPEAESVRSHPSSHHTADQSLLPSSATPPIPRPQPHRLQRRNHYHYMNGVLVPTSPTDFRQNQQQQQQLSRPRGESTGSMGPPSRHRPGSKNNSNDNDLHKRSKSYSASGGGWLLGSASAFVAESRRSSSWTGERREIRKLQKEHPVGSARPSFSLEIGEGDGEENSASGLRRSSSMLGVKRRMERLRGLYRKGDKEVVSGWASSR